jgi:ribonucleoside-triphosphate reductase (formate)
VSNKDEVNNNIKVVKEKNGDSDDLTDMELLITSGSKEEILEYDKQKIVDSLMRETGMARSTASQIASKVDKEIKSQNYNTVSTSYIRELIQLELRRRGFTKKVEEYDNIIFPIYNIENIIESSTNGKPKEINATISSYVLRDFSLKRVFSSKIRDAHLSGSIHIHGLNKPTSFYQGVTNFEYIKNNGLEIFGKNFYTNQINDMASFLNLVSHFSEYFQKYFVGAIGFVYSNVLLAPFFQEEEDNVENEIKNFMSSLGGANRHDNDNTFVEFGLSWSIPDELKNVPALGPNGKYMVVIEKKDAQGNKKYEKIPLLDKIIRGNKWKPRYIKLLQEEEEDEILNIEIATYGDFENESRKIASIMSSYNDIKNIDCNFLSNIKLILLINKNDCQDDDLLDIVNNTINLDVFFVDNQQKYVRQPCGVNFNLNGKNSIFNQEIDKLNEGILQHITINLPQCAYTALNDDKDIIFERLSEILFVVAEAHNQKKKYIKKIDSIDNINSKINIINQSNPNCSIGFVGLNEFIDFILIHNEDIEKSKADLRLEILSYIYLEINKYSEEMGLNLVLEESIFNSVNMRFAKIDVKNYPDKAKQVIQGDKRTNNIYYSDSDRLNCSDKTYVNDYINNYTSQQMVIKGHANMLIFLDNLTVSKIKKIFDYISSISCEVCILAQNFYICSQCSHVYKDPQEICENCDNADFEILAHDGYMYTLVSSWNETKKGEFEERKTVDLK